MKCGIEFVFHIGQIVFGCEVVGNYYIASEVFDQIFATGCQASIDVVFVCKVYNTLNVLHSQPGIAEIEPF